MNRNVALCLCLIMLISCDKDNSVLFTEDFEAGLENWDITSPHKVKIVDSGDPEHKNVLELHPNGAGAFALIEGSEKWENYSVEADFMFPVNHHVYLGFIYNYVQNLHRADFGSVYIFGPYGPPIDSLLPAYQSYLSNQEPIEPSKQGNIIWANPHRDFKACRSLYPEFYTNLRGDDAVRSEEWHRLKAIVSGTVCQLFIDDMEIPKITFDAFEFSSGKAGFKPRYSGSQFWLDNVVVNRDVPLKPQLGFRSDVKSNRELCINKWKYFGPFHHDMDSVVLSSSVQNDWKQIDTDNRGCVVVDRITEFRGGKRFAYFQTDIDSDEPKEANLLIHSVNGLSIWLNGEKVGFTRSKRPNVFLWPDFITNPSRERDTLKINLTQGKNNLIIRAAGGRYSGDGFYVALDDSEI